jgi:D-sedoheptulose 7-phosphate isomerase
MNKKSVWGFEVSNQGFQIRRFAFMCESFENHCMTHESIQSYFSEHAALLSRISNQLAPKIIELGNLLVETFSRGNRVYTFGNGGSAADSMHLAEELIGRFHRTRRPLPATALMADGTAVTCIANDFGYEELFARQIQALVVKGDVVIAFSTSGNSENVLRGLVAAKGKSAVTVALLGKGGGKAATLADHAIIIPTETTAHIQEMHMMIVHLLCDIVDRWAAGVP